MPNKCEHRHRDLCRECYGEIEYIKRIQEISNDCEVTAVAVPDFQSIMLPLLTLAGDGQEHSYRETIDRLADEFQLSEEIGENC